MEGVQIELIDTSSLQRQQKQERRDKGLKRINARDLILVRWIAEQYAVRLDQLQNLIAMKSENAKRANPTTVSERAAIKALDRWRALGWVEYRKIMAGADNPGWVWVTAKGLKDLGFDFTYREPTISQLKHYYWVNHVRMHLELKFGNNIQWVGERQLRREYAELERDKSKKESVHFPDGEMISKSGRTAIEVELTQKSASREVEIVKLLDTKFDAVKGGDYYWQVLYFVNDSTATQMKTAIDGRRKFKITNLREVKLYG